MGFLKIILFIRIPRLKKVEKWKLINYTQAHMQMDLKILPTKLFFFKTSTVFFPPLFKYHVIFQDQSEDCIDEDDIIDIAEVIVF